MTPMYRIDKRDSASYTVCTYTVGDEMKLNQLWEDEAEYGILKCSSHFHAASVCCYQAVKYCREAASLLTTQLS